MAKMFDGWTVRPVSFDDPIRNMDHRVKAEPLQVFGENRRGCRPVDIIVAEDRNLSTGLDRIRDPCHGGVHIDQTGRIGHQQLE